MKAINTTATLKATVKLTKKAQAEALEAKEMARASKLVADLKATLSTTEGLLTEKEAKKAVASLALIKPNALIANVTLEVLQMLAEKCDPKHLVAMFKKYTVLDKGNMKLATSIGSFSLLPVVTCGQRCQGCYDVRSLRYPSVRLKRTINTMLALAHRDFLGAMIQGQISRSKTLQAVRIHVGGDFFSAEYAEFWAELKRANKGLDFYTYTKTAHTLLLQMAGVNVVRSLLADGSYNYGPKEEIKAKAKEVGGIVCPATLGKVPNRFCGNKCKACIQKQDVFFVIH